MKSTERARVKKMIARNDKVAPTDMTWRPKSTATRKSVAQILGQQDGMKALKREFDAVTAKATAEAEAQAARQRKAAVAASRKRGALRNAMGRDRIKGFQAVGGLNNLTSDTPRFLLQTPFEISLVGANLTEHRIQTGTSFARFGFVFGSGRNSAARVHFSYVWQNPTDKYVLINAHGYVIFDGYIEVGVNGGFWPGDRAASLSVQGYMSVHDWGQAPFLPSATTLTQTAAALNESDGGFGAVGAIAAKDVFRGFDLDTSLYIVKPGGTIGLVIAANFPYWTGDDGGRVVADFEEGGHRVTSPGVLIQIVS
ncbi:hypothetical protein [Dongia sp.]|uniref:hypothetical protein n=1 Tax=Dongia sp. TaxID=1977262 RepID=UPI0035AF8A41